MLPPIQITDPQDRRLDLFRRLKQHLHRPDPERFFAETERLVRRLLKSRFPVEAVLITPPRLQRLAPLIPPEVPVFVAERPLQKRILEHNFHKGCVAIGRRLPLDQLEPAISQFQGGAGGLTVVAVDRQADPLNVGALLRNCRGFGVDLVLLDGRGADPFTPRALRAATGMTLFQPLVMCADLAGAVGRLKEQLLLQVWAATLSAEAVPLPAARPTARRLVLVGQEGAGLSPELLALADRQVTIPIAHEADSFNVAAATAVLLYAFTYGPTGT